ncbi:MAG: hypothetical protein ACI8R8_000396 [Paraglaciecola sp.]
MADPQNSRLYAISTCVKARPFTRTLIAFLFPNVSLWKGLFNSAR